MGRDSWGKLGRGTESAWQGHKGKACQERGTKIWGSKRGAGKAERMVGEEGCFFLRLEGGRRWEKSGLVQGWSGRGWGHALGCGQVSYGSWRCLGRCGGCNRIQPPGIVGTRTVIPALRAARCVLHSWERCREKRELVPGRWQNIHITPLGVTSLLPAAVWLEQ